MRLLLALAVAMPTIAFADDENADLTAARLCRYLERGTVICDMKVHAAQKKRAKEREEVAALLAAGKCDEARSTALAAGDVDEAVKVKTLCNT